MKSAHLPMTAVEMNARRDHPSFWRQRSREASSRARDARTPFGAAYWRWRARSASAQYDARVSRHQSMLPGARR
jgi:hypothetical protein